MVDIDADGSPERIAKLGELTERYCVVSPTLERPPVVHVCHRGVLLPQYE